MTHTDDYPSQLSHFRLHVLGPAIFFKFEQMNFSFLLSATLRGLEKIGRRSREPILLPNHPFPQLPAHSIPQLCNPISYSFLHAVPITEFSLRILHPLALDSDDGR